MNNEKIFLVVQSCGYKKKYRLGINTKNSQELFKKRGVSVHVILGESSTVNVKTTCGTPNNPINGKKYKKGYDLYSKKISDWIMENISRFKNLITLLLFHPNTPKLHLRQTIVNL